MGSGGMAVRRAGVDRAGMGLEDGGAAAIAGNVEGPSGLAKGA